MCVSVFCRLTDSVAEILKGIRSYFDKALPVMLLYKKERRQYQEAIVDDISPSTVYGAEHLLRLFGKIPVKVLIHTVKFDVPNFYLCSFLKSAVKLPELLSYVNMEEETWSRMQQTLSDFLK